MDVRPKLVFLIFLAVFLAAPWAGPVSGAASANLASDLVVFPQNAVPNQTVALLGTGFTASAIGGGSAGSGTHQITGLGASVITVDGVPLTAPNATYPIDFDSMGNWAASVIIPVTAKIVAGGPITITATDDQGLMQTAQVMIRTPGISLDPPSSRINTDLSVTGQGFPASNPATAKGSQVSISYAGVLLALVPADSSGRFDATVRVPAAAAVLSSNTVRAQVVGFSQWATAIHTVPGASITVSPASGRPGTVVTISGEGFPANVLVSSNRAGYIAVLGSPAPVTDGEGRFVSYFAMPLFTPGFQTITATAGGITAVSNFEVIEGAAVNEPLPAPQPSTVPEQALGSLTQGDNLVRVWTFDNASKTWSFFDPRPAFAKANTIRSMVPGRIYWLRLNRVQTAALNGKRVELFEGWNLVPW